MRERALFVILIAMFSVLNIFGQENSSLDSYVFYGVNVKNSDYTVSENELVANYSIAYSPFLPAGAVYYVTDKKSGKSAIVQIGVAKVNKSPFVLYLSDRLFSFFVQDLNVKEVMLTLKFIGWNRAEESALYLDILNFIVSPEKAVSEIKENDEDSYYIQLGAFSYYQNAYPQIVKLIPFFKIIPRFYLVKVGQKENQEIYRILAGPLSLKDAKAVTGRINEKVKNLKLYIQPKASILKDAVQ